MSVTPGETMKSFVIHFFRVLEQRKNILDYESEAYDGSVDVKPKPNISWGYPFNKSCMLPFK